mmetsp:Transcript_17818/g.25077  ORF Transcript_17818/g.25077 Transcript_17818/m.25077 type:complete len:86 (+) Transcript_17818:81-338(+)
MVKWDGHELAVLGTTSGAYAVANATLGPGWVKSFIHRQPVAAMSCALAGIGLLAPIIIVPIRRKLGMPTNQYDASFPGTVFPKYE